MILNRIGNPDISAIPNNCENFVRFSIVNNIEFIDSFQFMPSSLESLVENLYDKNDKNDKYNKFHNMKNIILMSN